MCVHIICNGFSLGWLVIMANSCFAFKNYMKTDYNIPHIKISSGIDDYWEREKVTLSTVFLLLTLSTYTAVQHTYISTCIHTFTISNAIARDIYTRRRRKNWQGELNTRRAELSTKHKEKGHKLSSIGSTHEYIDTL